MGRNALTQATTETWKQIDWINGIPSERYRVSNLGRVYSNHICRLLRPGRTATGYLGVVLNSRPVTVQKKVHALVAKAFVPNPNGYVEINHKDGDKANNRADNLEWCTRGENIAHAYKIGARSAKGENNARSILTRDKVAFIRGLRAIGVKKADIMRYMNLGEGLWQSIHCNWPDVQPTTLNIAHPKEPPESEQALPSTSRLGLWGIAVAESRR